MFDKQLLASKQVFVTFGVLVVTFVALLAIQFATNTAIERAQEPERELIAQMYVSSGLQDCLYASKPEAVEIDKALTKARNEGTRNGRLIGAIGLTSIVLLLYVSAVAITATRPSK